MISWKATRFLELDQEMRHAIPVNRTLGVVPIGKAILWIDGKLVSRLAKKCMSRRESYVPQTVNRFTDRYKVLRINIRKIITSKTSKTYILVNQETVWDTISKMLRQGGLPGRCRTTNHVQK